MLRRTWTSTTLDDAHTEHQTFQLNGSLWQLVDNTGGRITRRGRSGHGFDAHCDVDSMTRGHHDSLVRDAICSCQSCGASR